MVAEQSKQRDAETETRIAKEGVKVNTLGTEERGRWAQLVKDLPSKAAKELDGKGQPATEVMKTYIKFLGEAGYKLPYDYAL